MNNSLEHQLREYYRLPAGWHSESLSEKATGDSGFFRFGSETICYGGRGAGPTAKTAAAHLYDARNDVRFEGCRIHFPFDPSQVIENLRMERYASSPSDGQNSLLRHAWVHKAYYAIRELLPFAVRLRLQKLYLHGWHELSFPNWPVDFTVDTLFQDFLRLSMKARGESRIPFIWFWPKGAQNCLIMTHDVETSVGRDFSSQLMDLDDSYGIKASFQVIPEQRYELPDDYVTEIRKRGFELNIHDLNHDGALYRDREEFLRRAAKINEYARTYESQGFRSGAMYRNQEWYDAYDFSYDMSVPSVAHLEPQGGGCCTIMPYFVGKILEIPLTTTQDYSLFHILGDYSIDLWKMQLSLIRRKNGLMSFIIHPDYLIERRARKVVEALLGYLRQMVSQEATWMALPGEVNCWWRARSQMKLVREGESWTIEGPEKDRARLAYAVLEGNRLVYQVA